MGEIKFHHVPVSGPILKEHNIHRLSTSRPYKYRINSITFISWL